MTAHGEGHEWLGVTTPGRGASHGASSLLPTATRRSWRGARATVTFVNWFNDLLDSVVHGLSAGADPAWRGDHAAGLAGCARFSHGALELSVGSEDELPALLDLLDDPAFLAELDRFNAVSLHGPMKNLTGNWAELAATLAALPPVIRGIVFHPDTLGLVSLAELGALGPRLWFENMDVRKDDARTADELRPFFAACPDAGFVLDVAHVWCIDPTLALGHDLLDAYDSRLRELHVSGIEPDGKHRPTRASDLERYLPLLDRCRHVPWVIEAPLEQAAAAV